jgi:uncharacterized protein YprB with RNaseH-like and TPR domain
VRRLRGRLERMNPGARSAAEPIELPLPAPRPRDPNVRLPDSSSPDHVSPDHVSPDHVSPDHVSPDHVSPDHVDALRDWWHAPTPSGTAYVHRERLPAEPSPELPGFYSLLGDERLKGFHPEQALYIDIETTGLSHGAGTFAFLVGCAYFENGEIVLEQLFMRDPTDEMPVLARFLELIERFRYLVSFNGKSFDLSVLQTRLIMTRMLSQLEVGLKVRPHLDLLHVSRQAYKGVFSDTRLQTLEREVLGLPAIEREDDVPGSLVPAIYFHYLHTGYAPQLDVVLRHNRTDVLSMISLTNHLMTLMDAPGDAAPRVLFNLGRAALRKKHNVRAADLLDRAVRSRALTFDVHRQALEERVNACRRADDVHAACQAARDLLAHLMAHEDEEHSRVTRQIQRYQRKVDRLLAASEMSAKPPRKSADSAV